MSGYHYKDHRGCTSCNDADLYVPISKQTDYTCDQPCLCRFSNERSVKDKMYYDIFVLGKQVDIPPNIIQQARENFTYGRVVKR